MQKILLPTLVAALALAGCGGSTSPTSPTSTTSASTAPDAPSTAASSAAAPSSSAPTEAPTTSTAEVKDPCDVIDAAKVKELTGVSVKKGTGSEVGGYQLCSWTPSNPASSSSAFFTAQEGTVPAGTLDEAASQLEKQFDAKVSKITVKGADDARYLVGKKSGLAIVDVLAVRGEVIYQVLAAAPNGDPGKFKDGARAMTEVLIAA